MKYNVSDIMKVKIAVLLIAFLSHSVSAQVKYEREFRIKKSQFPEASFQTAAPYLDGVRKLRFYKEIDSSNQRFKMKFKRDKLYYSLEFSDQDALEAIEILIESIDIPEDSFNAMQAYLNVEFANFKIRKIHQQYPRKAFSSAEETFRNAFQNLILEEIRYELLVASKTADGKLDYEIFFDSRGQFLARRKSLPPNYDHVLY